MNQRRARRRRSRAAFGLLLLCWASTQALARVLPPGEGHILAAGSEQRLWIVQSTPAKSRFFSRLATGTLGVFDLTASISDGVSAIYPAGETACFVILDDGTIYRRTADNWCVEINLPHKSRPFDAVASANETLYALVPSDATAQMPLLVGAGDSATTQPFSPGRSALSIARYFRGDWYAVTACPENVAVGDDRRLGPRLMLINAQLVLTWASSPREIQFAAFDSNGPSGQWRPIARKLEIDGLRAFWTTVVQPRPVFVAEIADGERSEIVAYRIPLTAAAAGDKPLDLHLLAPADEQLLRFENAFGFNQHLGLVAKTASDADYVVFAGIGADAAEPPINVRTVLAKSNEDERDLTYLQSLSIALPLIVAALIFGFRRKVLFNPASVPATDELAFTHQRLIGFTVDFTPFMFVTAWLVHVPPFAGLQQLLGLARPTEISRVEIPPSDLALWWTLSVAAYTLYSLGMELVVGRTLGKLLTGTRLLNMAGRKPEWWRTVIRNVVRLFELLPPLWVLGFLVVLSRNRQRIGDIFAGTVVTRKARSTDAGL